MIFPAFHHHLCWWNPSQPPASATNSPGRICISRFGASSSSATTTTSAVVCGPCVFSSRCWLKCYKVPPQLVWYIMIYQWYIYQKHINKPAAYSVHITRWCQPHQWYLGLFSFTPSHSSTYLPVSRKPSNSPNVICTPWRSQICLSGKSSEKLLLF